jgi:RimJ/RimL family protein N-acetyltransferase
MTLDYAQKMVAKSLPLQLEICETLRSFLPPTTHTPFQVPVPITPYTNLADCPFTILRDSTGKIVGEISMHPSRSVNPDMSSLARNQQVWKFGYVMDESVRGKGVGKEIAGFHVEFAKVWLGVGKMIAVSWVRRWLNLNFGA